MLFSQISGMQASELPWGEWISKLNGVPSPIGWTFHMLTYLAFAWALAMVARQFLRGERLAAALLGSCLVVQFAALLWGDLVIDVMGKPVPVRGCLFVPAVRAADEPVDGDPAAPAHPAAGTHHPAPARRSDRRASRPS